MIVKIAEHSGFCFGVRQALETAEKTIADAKGGKIYSFGPRIHNRSVNEDLMKKGLVITDDLDVPEEGSTVIVRSHGEPESFYDEARQRGFRIVDATCPFVAKIHRLVSEAYKEGKNILIVGDRAHPEVQGRILCDPEDAWNGQGTCAPHHEGRAYSGLHDLICSVHAVYLSEPHRSCKLR